MNVQAPSPQAPSPTRLDPALDGVVRPVGSFYATSLDTLLALFRRPFYWREFLDVTAFLVKVSLVPAILLAIPFCAIVVFLINQLLAQLGATDLAGAGAGLAVVRQLGPLCSVLVVAGAGATAICADLGARTVREEIDALKVIGIDPIQRLVVPRVLASIVVATGLTAVVIVVGLLTGYLFSVLLQGASPGQYVANLTLLTTPTDFLISELKASLFGLAAGLVACYRGLHVSGGPKAVGEAVNQSVVYAFVILFIVNALISAIYLQFG